MDVRPLVGQNLRRLRLEKGWSQEELAFRSDVDRTYVSGVERGVRNPTCSFYLSSGMRLESKKPRFLKGGDAVGERRAAPGEYRPGPGRGLPWLYRPLLDTGRATPARKL